MSKAINNKVKLNSFVFAEEFGAKADGIADDTLAIQTALNTKKHVLLTPGKEYCVGGLFSVAEGSLMCIGGRATLKVNPGLTRNGIIINTSDFVLDGVNFEGGATGPFNVASPTPGSRNGIVIGNDFGTGQQIQNVTVQNCDVTGFSYAGVYGREVQIGFVFGKRVTLHNINAYNNYVNFWFTPRFEYSQMTQCYGYAGYAGIIVQGGNNKVTSSSFEGNYENCQLSSGENNSHGGFVNCSFNHTSGGYGLNAVNADLGMAFTNCFFWYAPINLVNCTGIIITNSEIVSSGITVNGGGVNAIDNNYIRDPITPVFIGYTFTTFRNNRTSSTDTSYVPVYGDVYVSGNSTALGLPSNIATNKSFINLRPTFNVKRYQGVDQSWLQNLDYMYVPRTGKYEIAASVRMNIGTVNEIIKLSAAQYNSSFVMQDSFTSGQYYPANTQNAVITLNTPLLARQGDAIGLLISTDTATTSSLSALDVRIRSID